MKRIAALILFPAAGSRGAGITQSAYDEQNLGAYLNQHFYQFK